MTAVLSTLERARGRWREILPQLGIPITCLVNKHGPCPLCGGRDRFRYDDRDGSGTYYCHQCGAGSGIIMVRKKHGWDHRTACDEVDKIIGTDAQPAPIAPPKSERDGDRRRSDIERLLAEAREPRVVEAYLIKRGLAARSDVLLGHPRCSYFDEEAKMITGRYPAVVAPIIGPGGELQSAQRIYDADVGSRKKVMPPVETIKGGAVRLFDPDEVLGVGEGVETMLAVRELFGVPTWAALTAGNLEVFNPPPGLLRLRIFADNDESFTGQQAAFALARRLQVSKTGLIVEVHVPPVAGQDWLDLLNEGWRP